MGRVYAGILGPTAFAITVARGVIGGSVESTLRAACVGLFVFAALGYVAGQIAESIINESIRVQLDAEKKAREESESAEGNRSAETT